MNTKSMKIILAIVIVVLTIVLVSVFLSSKKQKSTFAALPIIDVAENESSGLPIIDDVALPIIDDVALPIIDNVLPIIDDIALPIIDNVLPSTPSVPTTPSVPVVVKKEPQIVPVQMIAQYGENLRFSADPISKCDEKLISDPYILGYTIQNGQCVFMGRLSDVYTTPDGNNLDTFYFREDKVPSNIPILDYKSVKMSGAKQINTNINVSLDFDKSNCMATCQKDITCNGFYVDNETNKCVLFLYAQNGFVSNFAEPKDFYYKNPANVPTVIPEIAYDPQDFVNTDIYSIRGKTSGTFEQCSIDCLNDFRCIAFTRPKVDNSEVAECSRLGDLGNKDSNIKGHSTLQTFVLRGTPLPNDLVDITFTSSDFIVGPTSTISAVNDKTVDECDQICRDSLDCKGYTSSKDSNSKKICIFKNNLNNVTVAGSNNYETRVKSTTTLPTNIPEPTTYVTKDFFADPKIIASSETTFVSATSDDECKNECTDRDQQCMAYSYSNNSCILYRTFNGIMSRNDIENPGNGNTTNVKTNKVDYLPTLPAPETAKVPSGVPIIDFSNFKEGLPFDLLDNTVKTATTGLFHTRKISSQYTGPIFNVYLDSQFVNSFDIFYDSQLKEYTYNENGNTKRLADLLKITPVPVFIRTWYDQSGKNANLVQTVDLFTPMLNPVTFRVNFEGNRFLIPTKELIYGNQRFTVITKHGKFSTTKSEAVFFSAGTSTGRDNPTDAIYIGITNNNSGINYNIQYGDNSILTATNAPVKEGNVVSVRYSTNGTVTNMFVNSTPVAFSPLSPTNVRSFNFTPKTIAIGGQRSEILKDTISLYNQYYNSVKSFHGELEFIFTVLEALDDTSRVALERIDPTLSSSNAPKFDSFEPNVIPLAGGVEVRLRGSRLSNISSISFENSPANNAQNIKVISDNEITFTAPPAPFNESSKGTSKIFFYFTTGEQVVVSNGMSYMRKPPANSSTTTSTSTTIVPTTTDATTPNTVDIRTFFNIDCATNQIMNPGTSDDKVTFLGTFESYADCMKLATIPQGNTAITYFDATQTNGTAKQCYAIKNFSNSNKKGATCGIYGNYNLGTILPKKAYGNFRDFAIQRVCGYIEAPLQSGNGYTYIGKYSSADECYAEYKNNPKYRNYNLGYEPKSLVYYQCATNKCISNGLDGAYSKTCYVSSGGSLAIQNGSTCFQLTTTYDPAVSTFTDVDRFMSTFGNPHKKNKHNFY